MFKFCLGFMPIFILCSQTLLAMEGTLSEKTHYLFVGNPGVGKSAIINGIVGKKIFASGLNIGAGLTKYLQHYEHKGDVYIDTPGLADIESKEAAAKEIEKSLKMGGKYHLFFVFNLNALRILDQDLATMELILDAIDHPEKKFSIIINKITKEEMHELEQAEKLAELLFLLQKHKYSTDYIWLLLVDKGVCKKRKEFIEIDEKTRHFIFRLSPSMSIDHSQVKRIEWNKYEELKKTTSKRIVELERKIEDNDDEIKELIKEIKSFRKQPPIERPPEYRTEYIRDTPHNNSNGFVEFVSGVATGIGVILTFFM